MLQPILSRGPGMWVSSSYLSTVLIKGIMLEYGIYSDVCVRYRTPLDQGVMMDCGIYFDVC